VAYGVSPGAQAQAPAAPAAGGAADPYAAQSTAALATYAAYYGMTVEQYMAAAQSYAAVAASYGMTPEQYMASLYAYAAWGNAAQAAAPAASAAVAAPARAPANKKR